MQPTSRARCDYSYKESTVKVNVGVHSGKRTNRDACAHRSRVQSGVKGSLRAARSRSYDQSPDCRPSDTQEEREHNAPNCTR